MESFGNIDSQKWKNACSHVCTFEEKYWKKDNIQCKEVNPIVINLGDDSSDSEWDDLDCDEETEDYEYC